MELGPEPEPTAEAEIGAPGPVAEPEPQTELDRSDPPLPPTSVNLDWAEARPEVPIVLPSKAPPRRPPPRQFLTSHPRHPEPRRQLFGRQANKGRRVAALQWSQSNAVRQSFNPASFGGRSGFSSNGPSGSLRFGNQRPSFSFPAPQQSSFRPLGAYRRASPQRQGQGQANIAAPISLGEYQRRFRGASGGRQGSLGPAAPINVQRYEEAWKQLGQIVGRNRIDFNPSSPANFPKPLPPQYLPRVQLPQLAQPQGKQRFRQTQARPSFGQGAGQFNRRPLSSQPSFPSSFPAPSRSAQPSAGSFNLPSSFQLPGRQQGRPRFAQPAPNPFQGGLPRPLPALKTGGSFPQASWLRPATQVCVPSLVS